MAIRYQVTIKKVETDVEYPAKEYQQLFSDFTWSTMTEDERATAGGRPYGYVETVLTKYVETELFNQSVEELDIPAVVAVVNDLMNYSHHDQIDPAGIRLEKLAGEPDDFR